jgi:hypothetical protein
MNELFDLRDCILHSYHSGTDEGSGSNNKLVKSPGHTLACFLRKIPTPCYQAQLVDTVSSFVKPIPT